MKGEPILMWDAPEAEHKNIWSLTRDQRAAVLESREILKKNQKKEKQAQHDKLLRQKGAVCEDGWIKEFPDCCFSRYMYVKVYMYT